jgi:hypothetical protein
MKNYTPSKKYFSLVIYNSENDAFLILYPIECTVCQDPAYLLRIIGMNDGDLVYTSLRMMDCKCTKEYKIGGRATSRASA